MPCYICPDCGTAPPPFELTEPCPMCGIAPRLVTEPCPVCGQASYLSAQLDRYIHLDGSANRSCWVVLSRGGSRP